ncbi:alpha/beta fold hydrolase [Piscirickettsia litoralis]|uniref:alpha/beta fold hydrolase n=1 Tax=Piscirickettsia litoralis TaxID=1891921 RepID=UPI001F2539F0|nr:hypothetical protein [Piscirickettsia litoralis]
MLEKLECPVAFVRAKEGILPHSAWFDRRLAAVAKLYTYELPGSHHFHLEVPDQVSECINAFWQQTRMT